MKVVGVASLTRRRAPRFSLISRHETIQLRKLPLLCRALFWELVGLADFATGEGKTSYPVLIALLSYDVPPCSHDTAGGASIQQIRDALEQLGDLGLVTINKMRNKAERCLFFKVEKRVGIATSAGMKNKAEDQARSPMKNGRKRGMKNKDEDQGVQEGFSIKKSLSPTPSSLPESAAVNVRELAEATKRRIAAKRAAAASSDRATRS